MALDAVTDCTVNRKQTDICKLGSSCDGSSPLGGISAAVRLLLLTQPKIYGLKVLLDLISTKLSDSSLLDAATRVVLLPAPSSRVKFAESSVFAFVHSTGTPCLRLCSPTLVAAKEENNWVRCRNLFSTFEKATPFHYQDTWITHEVNIGRRRTPHLPVTLTATQALQVSRRFRDRSCGACRCHPWRR